MITDYDDLFTGGGKMMFIHIYQLAALQRWLDDGCERKCYLHVGNAFHKLDVTKFKSFDKMSHGSCIDEMTDDDATLYDRGFYPIYGSRQKELYERVNTARDLILTFEGKKGVLSIVVFCGPNIMQRTMVALNAHFESERALKKCS